ncbi:M81 family metallopeptidase [Bacillus sp. CGMCC 1.16607]|uniref:M81 family metallopeptidase n=1 Tax=Bacillus sp. CGMCC 1.16607 TaxID=3351842 RepID=UPI00363E0027
MKILIGQVAHETNTFSNVPTTIDSFKLWDWEHGDAILQKNRGVRGFLGGLIDRAESLGHEVVPTFSAFAYPTGIITLETFVRLKNELLDSIKSAGEYDAICLSLHGAGVVETIDDFEGELLKSVREIVGYDTPLVVTLDLHANVTELMVKEANAIVGNNFYPHIDCYEIGQEAINLTIEIVNGNIHPTMHLLNLPLIIPTSATSLSPAKEINELCWKWEGNEHVLDCTFYHGFPFTDIPQIGVSVLATTNNNPSLAKEAAETVAMEIWKLREEFTPKTLSPIEGINEALQSQQFPVVMNETSDNPGGGTPGDGTHLLRELIQQKVKKTCFGFIYDPEVVEVAHKAGVGSTIDILLGGKTDHLHGEPIALKAYVKCLTDGCFVYTNPIWRGRKENQGKSVRLQVDDIDIIVCSVKSQVLDDEIFKLHGINVTEYQIVALKSSTHFRACFENLSNKIITVDSPGLTTLDFTSFDYKRVNKPIYPLQDVQTEAILK